MLLLIDNFDSFSHMLADLIRQTGEELQVVRNDVSLAELKSIQFEGLILSPGPGIPKQAGNLMAILEEYHQRTPILGVCLGHQAVGEFFGASLVKNRKPTHGKVYAVNKVGQPELLENLPKTFQVTRYHSLQLQQLPQEIIPILETNSGEIMGIQHSFLPIVGVQYHPEALLTEYGLELIHSWLKLIPEKITLNQ
ncbi:MAG TPA: aminodeoxychorismate/anthranilate synthase component II [Algoriphagus sp.]|jgi:anthranilate synthase component 2|uniref:anthranilate synthase component II n=1 Tax=unclassified Algoriphagus TaxID=2641541 RepID=UPI000C586F14|nr:MULTISPECIES: aminodeoxychorismate/anthranilate synthase component II [unclassified Algoriphagus]MAL12284.1 aminodeoxychorismate/anthranilate synthase component II [Algoriphagus sp.]HAD50028.1 aminodeoxychorismate/anthranilate synthase component II [Algoriphagus sp.]HAS58304.1 aminodeoxychorismate/anthranilate synthase component II [Algoriphagus sp.]HCB47084.1 aminodeoxychorismate/anthranilate synthase component II [Algoriphagus sp.]HCD87968.1 aminodeoxychorismate/anthranilate synthase comp|tara:strand:- start:321 stop:905 length:585 start_codon:yes stop_codon:yes gene_type:complete